MFNYNLDSYTKGAQAAANDYHNNSINDNHLFGTESLYCIGYRDQWEHMIKPDKARFYPRAVEIWNKAGNDRAERLRAMLEDQE